MAGLVDFAPPGTVEVAPGLDDVTVAGVGGGAGGPAVDSGEVAGTIDFVAGLDGDVTGTVDGTSDSREPPFAAIYSDVDERHHAMTHSSEREREPRTRTET